MPSAGNDINIARCNEMHSSRSIFLHRSDSCRLPPLMRQQHRQLDVNVPYQWRNIEEYHSTICNEHRSTMNQRNWTEKYTSRYHLHRLRSREQEMINARNRGYLNINATSIVRTTAHRKCRSNHQTQHMVTARFITIHVRNDSHKCHSTSGSFPRWGRAAM